MYDFTYHNPTKIIFGKNTIDRIGRELKTHGQKKVLLLAGGGSIKRNGVYDVVLQSLNDAGIERSEVWDVRVNPVLTKVQEAIAVAKQEQVDAILGVGGGSVIDSAKAIAAGFYRDDVWTAFEEKTEIEKALPIFTVLTLSATGTEMNPYAVITNEAQKKKWALYGPALHPQVSIIDPTAQKTLPWMQTVYGAIDAISHIMEFHVLGKTEETTIALNESLMRSIIKSTDRLKENPGDYESRASLAWATTLALNGISGIGLRGGDWSTHMIEHSVSAYHPDVAHAAGLGVIFPAWILHMKEKNPTGFQRWAKNVWEADTVEQAVEVMRRKYESWGAAVTLDGIGVHQNEIDTLADNAMLLAPLGQLKPLSRDDIVQILKLAA